MFFPQAWIRKNGPPRMEIAKVLVDRRKEPESPEATLVDPDHYIPDVPDLPACQKELPRLEHRLDPSQRLPRPCLVLNQREPHIIVPAIAKAHPWAYRNLRLQQQFLRE